VVQTIIVSGPLSGGQIITTVIDPKGQASSYTFTSGFLTNVRLPGSAVDNLAIAYDGNGRVSSVQYPSGTWTYSYAQSGNLFTTTSTDPTGVVRTTVTDQTIGQVVSDTIDGKTTSRTYDSFGRMQSVTMPEGNGVSYSYDGRGNVLQTMMTAKDGSSTITTSATYPSDCSNALTCNKPTTTIDARGKVTSYSYDSASGLVTSVSPPGQSTVTYSYTDVAAPGGGTIRMPSSITRCQNAGSCDAVTTTIGYAGSGNPLPTSVTTSGPGVSSTVTYSYTAASDVDTVSGPVAGMATRYYYDALRRVVAVVGPDPDGGGPLRNRAQNTVYRADGLVDSVQIGTTTNQGDQAAQSFAALQTTVYGYDAGGRRISAQSTGAGGVTISSMQYGYDAAGRQTSATVVMGAGEGPNRTTTNSYRTSDGRLASTTEASGTADASTTSYSYTPNGRLASLTDGESRATTFAYDGFDRAQTTRYADGSTEVLSYDPGGLVTQAKLRDGQTVNLGYDDAGRRTSRSGAGLNNAYGYDQLGRLVSATGGSYNVSLGYDALGNLVSDNVAGYAMLNGYDAAGRRTRVAWGIPDIYLQYALLTTGEPSQVADSYGNPYATFGWNDLGRPTQISYWPYYGVPIVTAYGYGADQRLATILHSYGQGAGTGQQNDVTIGLGYNPAGQIVSRTLSNDSYVVNAPAVDYAWNANALNQINAPSVPTSYDARGDQTQTTLAPGTQTTFDAENKLLTAYRDGSPQVSLEYDALDRLTTIQAGAGATKQRLVWNGDQLAGQLDYASGNVTDLYVYRGDERVPIAWRNGPSGQNRALIQDERGSIIALANKASGVERIHLYDEYGDEGGAPHLGLFGFTGHVALPGTGITHMRARGYDPRTGRFLSPDPIGYGDGVNLYGYVGGDPVNLVDPDGLRHGPNWDVKPVDPWTSPESRYDPNTVTVTGDPWKQLTEFLGQTGIQNFVDKFSNAVGGILGEITDPQTVVVIARTP